MARNSIHNTTTENATREYLNKGGPKLSEKPFVLITAQFKVSEIYTSNAIMLREVNLLFQ